jgi:hypothetical protein
MLPLLSWWTIDARRKRSRRSKLPRAPARDDLGESASVARS